MSQLATMPPSAHEASPGREPELSVILATPDVLSTQRSTVSHLRNQTVADRMEVIIVSPSLADADEMAPMMSGFLAYRFLPSPPTLSLAQQQAIGIHAARAPFVAVGEDHCQPHPRWAEKLIEAYRKPEGYAAVSPAVHVANESMLAVGSQLIDYLNWTAPVQSGELDYVSVTNASYRRDVILREYGDNLHQWIERGGAIYDDLRVKGHKFYLTAEAKCYHKNISTLQQAFLLRFNIGRFHAGQAAARMSLVQRLIKAILCVVIPLTPLLRFAKVVKRLTARKYPLTPKMLLGVAIGLAFDAWGQFIGYTLGAGNTLRAIYDFEFHREPRMKPSERGKNWVAYHDPEVRTAGYLEPVSV